MHSASEPAVTAEIASELYGILETFGAKSDLLDIIGSYGDTMDDAWVLDQLRRWRAGNEASAANDA